MTRSQWLVTAACAVLAVPVLAQKTGCDLVTHTEAATILGTSAAKLDKQALGAVCNYTVKGSTVTLIARISPNPTTSVDARKASFTKMGSTVKDEPGVGPGSFSAARPGNSRIFAPKGDQMFRLEYVDTAKGKAPDGLMDKLRAAAKKAVGRL
jgi:hypothetical protein